MGLGINRLWVVGIFVVNIYYYGRNQRNYLRILEQRAKIEEIKL